MFSRELRISGTFLFSPYHARYILYDFYRFMFLLNVATRATVLYSVTPGIFDKMNVFFMDIQYIN